MLFDTLNHAQLLIVFLVAGIVSGFIFDIGNYIKFLCSNKKMACYILDIVETILSCLVLYISNLFNNYGIVRLFPVVIFLFSFFCERITIGKIIAKLYQSCYTLFKNFVKRFYKKRNNEKTK